MFSFKGLFSSSNELASSELFDEATFYRAFLTDLQNCKNEVIIESPYMTSSRMEKLYPMFEKLLQRGVRVHIITRDPIDHDNEYMRHQATNEILYCKEIGVDIILLTGYHHRKIAIIDRAILWEGSLNILSFNSSKELMRRMKGKGIATQMFKFLKLSQFL